MSTESLFSPALLPSLETISLAAGYRIRPLQRTDYTNGFLDVLAVLTTVGDISHDAWLERYDFMKSRQGEYFVIVIEEEATGKIVGTGSLVVEKKFLRNLGLCGHIEDIAVAREMQGKQFGLKIIKTLDYIAEKVGCYKAILDCSENNEGFYVKCGYKRAGVQMAHYYGDNKPKN